MKDFPSGDVKEQPTIPKFALHFSSTSSPILVTTSFSSTITSSEQPHFERVSKIKNMAAFILVF
jgi:hypothetical protein